MATQLKLADAPGTDVVVAVTQNPGIVLLDREKFDAWYDKLKAEAPTDVDVTTNKGRDTLRSYAAKVRSEKASIDKARLRLTKEWRDMTAQANAAGKEIEERLERLAAEVRAPLTEWEEAERARVAECEATIARIKAAATVTIEDTAATVRERGAEIWGIEIAEDRFGVLTSEAEAAKAAAVETLKAALARLTKEEEDRAELERLRAEKEKREAADAAKREEEERAESKRQYARAIIEHIKQCGLGMIGGKTYPYIILIRELEEKIESGSRAEAVFGDMADDVEKARVETLAHVKEAQERQAEKLRQEAAEKAAQEAREQAERDKQAEIDAANRRAEEAERAAQAERDRIAAEEAARKAEAERIAAEQAKREQDQKHRSAVMKAAKEAIMTCGADEETAKKIVLLIRSGEVPNVTLRF